MYEVGLGDSPQRIARAFTGDAGRYRELLAANPHKPVVLVAGHPTFASLGVGERISIPESFGVGGYHGTSSDQDFQNLRRDLQAKTRQGRFAHVDKGKLQIDWPYHDQGWGNAAPRNHQDMMTIVGITKNDPFYPKVLAFFGLPPNAHITNGWSVAVTQSSGGGGFSLDPHININIDPGQVLKQLDPHINIDPGKLLHQIGIPTPDDMLHQLGLPSLGKILSDAGIPTDPANLFKDVVNPSLLVAQLVEHLPGIKEVAQYIPSMPDPTQMAMNIVNAAGSGDLNKLKGAVLDVGHEVADTLSMVPGLGSGISGPLDAAIALLESGSALRAALDLLLSEIPDIPPQIRDVFLRPAINAVSDIVDHGKSISDAFISSFKEGVMAEAKAKGFPAQLVGIISGFIDAVIQVILQHKPLDQAATGLAQKGLETAMSAAVSQAGASGGDLLKHLPSIPGGSDLLKNLPSLPGGGDLLKKLPSLPANGGDLVKQISALPGGAELLKKIPSTTDLQKELTQKAFEAVKSKIPADVANKVASLQQAYDTVKSVGNDSNTIHSLSQGIIALAKQDPHKTNPTVQKKIADLRTAISAHRANIRSGAKKLDANLGEAPTRKLIRLKLGNPPPPPPKKVIKLTLGPKPAPAPAPASTPAPPPSPAVARVVYPPYRQHGAIHGLGDMGDSLGRGGHGGGGGHHGGGGGHHGGGGPHGGGHRPRARPREFGGARWLGPNGWFGPWPYEAVYMTEVACSTWGDPVEMTPAMESVGQVQLRNSGGRPAAVRGADGVTYLFQMESGELTMRPCAAMSSTLGDAASPLYFAYVTQPGAAGWVALSATWQTVDQLIDTMSRTIVGNPAAPFEFGGYLWDGQAMRWQSLASLVARRAVA